MSRKSLPRTGDLFSYAQVIVGVNGSGKSTILKLVTRIYDPDEGQILLGGHDIRALKLRDLREAISVLFQDYTLFPLSVSSPLISRVSLNAANMS